MKKTVVLSFFWLLLLIGSSAIYGQKDTISVQRSDDKVIIGGDLYYIHIVEKGHTLYSISKAYNVSQKAIARENPDIFLGLRPGQALKIPFNPEEIDRFESRNTKEYKYHKVKKGETLYSLSRRYKVSEDIIKKNNPVLYEEQLKARQVIKIPRDKIERELAEVQKDTLKMLESDQRKGDYIYHRVKKKETLYSLSKRYNVKIEDIKKANAYLQRDELQYGKVIRIPIIEEPESSELFSEKRADRTKDIDTAALEYNNFERMSLKCNADNYFKRKAIDVTLFLPLYLEKNFKNYTIDSSEVDKNGEKKYKKIRHDPYYIYPGSENFIEFYEGILLALDSLKNSGIKVNLRTFDTKNNKEKVRNILFKEDFRNTDLIIGPVYSETFELVSQFAKENEIDIISPFSKKQELLRDHDNLIQVYPSHTAQLERFASYIANYSDKNMVLVHTGDSLYYPEVRHFKNQIFSYISKDTSLIDVSFKEVAFKDSLFYLEQAVNKEEENVIIVPSDDEAFVTDVVTNLNTLVKKGYNIKVFGYSQWKDFVNMDQEYFYNLNLTLFTPFHVDYQREPIKNVIREYRNTFKSEPSRFVFHGFDIGYYFFNAAYRYGRDFKDCMYNYDPPLCHSNYQFFKRDEDYGIENVSIIVLRYNQDFTIDEIILSLKSNRSFYRTSYQP